MMVKKLLASLGILLFSAPLMTVVGAGVGVHPCAFLPLILAAIVLALLIRLLPRGRVLLLVPLAALLLAGGTQYGFMLGVRFKGLIPAVLSTVLLICHLQALCRPAGDEYAPVVWYMGVAANGAALFLLRAQALAPATPYVQPLTVAYIVYIIFTLNEHALTNGMAGDRLPSRLMRWRNRTRAAVLAGGFVLLVYLQAVRDALSALVAAIQWLIGWLLSLLPEMETVTSEAGGGKMDLGGLGETAEPAMFWRILEEIVRWAALIAAAALTIFILYKFAKVLRRLVRYIIAQLRAYASRVNEAYEDTMESLLDWGEMKKGVRSLRDRLTKKPEPRVPYDALSPREKVRRTYQLLRKKASVNDSSTARAALLSGDMPIHQDNARVVADLYDAARYSSRDISEDEAAQVKKAAQRKKM